jgi:hypothetical protein
MAKEIGYILWESPSIVAIATLKTSNKKTGDMVQIWFLLKNQHPLDVVKSGLDATTICKGCVFASGNGCYVNVGKAPAQIWKTYRKGRYSKLDPVDYPKVFGNRKVRFGAYGNPSILPVSLIKTIAEISDGWTGYFHDWAGMDETTAKMYGQYLMASTDTEDSRCEAESKGLRYFHVSDAQPKGTRECLADTKDLECQECLLCQGNTKSRQLPIWINPHGSTRNKAILASS